MKRSQINGIIADAAEFIVKMNFRLPPFAFWSTAEWATKGHEYDEVRDNMLGWDITDFGSLDFNKAGLLLFTLRNGNLADVRYQKTYAEKVMVVEEEQVTPFHFHRQKMEDIINRGGGDLMIQLYNSTAAGEFANIPVTTHMDGRIQAVDAGTVVTLKPGESISLPPGQYHQFWGKCGSGRVLVGEVSMVNDDRVDNRFHDPVGRFPKIEEDAEPLYLLCNEYPRISI